MENSPLKYIVATEFVRADKEMNDFFDKLLSFIKEQTSPALTLISIKKQSPKIKAWASTPNSIIGDKIFTECIKIFDKISKANTEEEVLSLLITPAHGDSKKTLLEKYIGEFKSAYTQKYINASQGHPSEYVSNIFEYNRKEFIVKTQFELQNALSNNQKTSILKYNFERTYYDNGLKIFRIKPSITGKLFEILHEIESVHDEIINIKKNKTDS